MTDHFSPGAQRVLRTSRDAQDRGLSDRVTGQARPIPTPYPASRHVEPPRQLWHQLQLVSINIFLLIRVEDRLHRTLLTRSSSRPRLTHDLCPGSWHSEGQLETSLYTTTETPLSSEARFHNAVTPRGLQMRLLSDCDDWLIVPMGSEARRQGSKGSTPIPLRLDPI